MNELAGLMDEATEALTRMDAEALESLAERVMGLRGSVAPAEVAARMRVFSGLLLETGRGLEVLHRLGGTRSVWAR